MASPDKINLCTLRRRGGGGPRRAREGGGRGNMNNKITGEFRTKECGHKITVTALAALSSHTKPARATGAGG